MSQALQRRHHQNLCLCRFDSFSSCNCRISHKPAYCDSDRKFMIDCMLKKKKKRSFHFRTELYRVLQYVKTSEMYETCYKYEYTVVYDRETMEFGREKGHTRTILRVALLRGTKSIYLGIQSPENTALIPEVSVSQSFREKRRPACVPMAYATPTHTQHVDHMKHWW